jgi:isoquinoline 1-oxidoreductase beta subunit
MHIKRRHFLVATTGAAGALLVGWLAMPPRQRLLGAHPLPTARGQTALNGWVKVGTDDSVTVMMSQAEMGQGAHTGLAMLLAEEMDAAWESVRLEQAPLDRIYNNQAAIVDAMFAADAPGVLVRAERRVARRILREIPDLSGTGGSSSITDQWLPLREAGAAARALLLAAAAQQWQVAVAECRTAAGRVLHPSGRSARYGELVPLAGRLPLPRHVPLKHGAQFRLIGQPLLRLDNAAKIDGSAQYAIDALPPDLLYASLVMCPSVGGRAAHFDASRALQLAGVRKVVKLDPVAGGFGGAGTTAGAVAAIATTPFQAMRALEVVRIEWDHGPAAAGLSSDKLLGELRHALDTHAGHTRLQHGDVDAALHAAPRTLRAEYRVPFLAHAPMEPLNATVQFRDGSATVWAATQAPGAARAAVARVLGIPAQRVQIHVPFLGGGFGRRYLTDCLQQAAALARETGGAPLQLLWPREQDIAHDYFRPAFLARCEAGLDATGRLLAWKMTTAGSSLGAPSFADMASDGAANTAYAFPNARVAHQGVESAVPVGIWRSVSHSYNAFFVECFIDEAAAAAGQDPVRFRAGLLADNARYLRVLERVAQLSEWATAPAAAADGARCARGIAVHGAFGSIVGQVAEVSVTADGQIRVHRVVCVIDCGLAVNPNLIRQQIEGAVAFGLSAVLHGEITLENGQVRQSNFHDYVPLRMFECPQIVTEIIQGADTPGGIGECGTPPIAPAVANAVFALTGQRLRSLPLKLT